jgi:hypothetical protein
MKLFLRNLRFLATCDLKATLGLFFAADEVTADLLDYHWHQIRVLNGEKTGEFLKRRPGGNDALTRVKPPLSIPAQIAAEVDAIVHPPVKPVAPARAKKRPRRKR